MKRFKSNYERFVPMKKLLALCCVAAVAGTVWSADRIWKGWGGVRDWNDSANWENGVPSGTDRAVFRHSSHPTNNVYRVTPPASFAGTIICSNFTAGVENSYISGYFTPQLELTVAQGAAWKVTGTGLLLATDGLADRIATDFTGEIVVRKGDGFSAPATLNSGVRIKGLGDLTLATSSQLTQTTAFLGPITVAAGDLTMTDAKVLAGRNVTLAGDQTLTLDTDNPAMMGAVQPISDFVTQPEAWNLCGSAYQTNPFKSHAVSMDPPYVEDGKLILTDDPCQVHVAVYTNRIFRSTDDMEFAFTWEPKLPSPSKATEEGRNQILSCRFDVGFQGEPKPTVIYNNGSSINRANQVAGFWGIGLYFYTGDKDGHLRWNLQDAKTDGRFHEKELGLDVHKAIDFFVRKAGDEMTVTLVQGDKSVVVSRNMSTALGVCQGGGYYLTLGATSDTWGSNQTIPWSRQEIGNFRGWYHDPLEGGWSDHADNAKFANFTADNYTMQRTTWLTTPPTTNEGANCVLADGSVKVQLAENDNSFRMVSKSYLTDKRKPLKLSWELKSGRYSRAGSGGNGVSFLLFGSDNVGAPKKNDYGLGGWCYGFKFELNLYGGAGNFGLDHLWYQEGDSKPGNKAYTSPSTSWVTRGDDSGASTNKTFRMDFVHDTQGTVSAIVSSKTPMPNKNGQCTRVDWTFPSECMTSYRQWQYESNRKSYVGFRASAGQNNYMELELRKFRLQQLDRAEAGVLPGEVRIRAGQSTSFVAGELLDGQNTRVVTLAKVALGANSTFTVMPRHAATKMGIATVEASSPATLTANAGAAVEVGDVTLTGDDTDTGVTLAGNVTFGDTLTLTVPSAWRHTQHGVVTAIDASGATAGLGSLTADKVVVRDEDGVIPAKKYDLEIKDGKLFVNLTHGMAILLR